MTQEQFAAACGLCIPSAIKRAKALGLDTRNLSPDDVDKVKAIPKYAGHRSRPSLLKAAAGDKALYRRLRIQARKMFGEKSKKLTGHQIERVVYVVTLRGGVQ